MLKMYLTASSSIRTQTMGIITKPDVLKPGSPEEEQALSLAKGRDCHLGYSWHVLKNRDYSHSSMSTKE